MGDAGLCEGLDNVRADPEIGEGQLTDFRCLGLGGQGVGDLQFFGAVISSEVTIVSLGEFSVQLNTVQFRQRGAPGSTSG